MQLISTFVFATKIGQSLYFLNPKFLAIFCCFTARFVSDLVGNPEGCFSHNEAQIETEKSIQTCISNIAQSLGNIAQSLGKVCSKNCTCPLLYQPQNEKLCFFVRFSLYRLNNDSCTSYIQNIKPLAIFWILFVLDLY